ncbi:type I secretion system permease/ATPase [Sphingobium chlorophenolicum]|uniref:Putative ABC transporter ATP-binding protein/permease n=1 Tax=Sphingobium chlorophenolicum TaxID=46429 RepID=A0A081RDX8_SPHCR|nr:type I secretion system permease/ATPase [Sphingobium chlorophenolicum]KEQ53401.1 putative ABC transporter ATP-binding protein/permease [Sphingobium chlorophenolicum]
MATAISEPILPPATVAPRLDPLREGLVLLCRELGRATNAAELGDGMPLEQGRLPVAMVPRALRRIDVAARVAPFDLAQVEPYLLPALILLRNGDWAVLAGLDADGADLLLPGSGGGQQRFDRADLAFFYEGTAIFAKPRYRADGRAGAFAQAEGKHWFFGTLKNYRRDYLEVALAAMMANLLAIGSALFAMQVYDRVVPNAAFDTLWILASGVGLALLFEAVLRVLRAHLLDTMGKRLDLRLSSQLFERVLNTRLAAKPPSLGAFSTQIREFESVREFFTASSAAVISDLPFVLVFLALIALLGGPIVWVPVAAILLIVLPGMLSQRKLGALSRRNLREGAVKNSILLESIENLETLKAARGEGRALHMWENLTAELAGTASRTATLTAMLSYGATLVQQLGYVGVILFGVYRISTGDMTMGALVACSILSSRGIAPMSQAASILGRWQHVRVAMEGLDQLMASPVERPAGKAFVRKEKLAGAFRLEEVTLQYGDNPPVVHVGALSIGAGERVALLGGNGAGKSSLLRLLSGLGDTASGRILLDDVNLHTIDPADRRHAIGYLPQDVALLHGTLRDNLNLSGAALGDAELFDALDAVGLGAFVRANPLGLDAPIQGSASLSGGQRQAVGLARLLLQDPQIVLLDEPTAFFDQASENHVIDYLQGWLGSRTLIATTHKRSLLALVDRAVVLRHGRVVMDGPLDGIVSGDQVRTGPANAAPANATPANEGGSDAR